MMQLKSFRLIAAVMALVCFGAVQTAQAQYSYTDNGDGTCTITAYTGPGGVVTIPSSISGLTVISIGANAFTGIETVTAVNLPDSLTSIGSFVFGNCYSLTNVSFESDVSIGATAFNYCTNLIDASGGTGTITGVGDSAFDGCSKLTNIRPIAGSIGQYAFTLCNSLTNVALLNGVTSIGQNAFAYCYDLPSITMPNTVTSIGMYSFEDCRSLTNLILSTSITNIPFNAFFDCADLDAAIIPAGVTSVGGFAFSACFDLNFVLFQGNAPVEDDAGLTFGSPVLQVIYYRAGTTGWGTTFDGIPTKEFDFNFQTLNGQVAITGYIGSGGPAAIPATIEDLPVTSISPSAFFGASFTSITVPASVTNIGAGAFADCASLTAINVNPTNAFYSSVNGVLFDKNQDTLIQFPGGPGGSYVIPGSVSTIASDAFADCSDLVNVVIPGSVNSIGSDAFAGCPSLIAAIFDGNAPPDLGDAYSGDGKVTVYYLTGSSGWGSTFGGAPAQLFPFNFTVNNNTITITGYTGPGGAVTIPPAVGAIAANLFANNSSLTSVSIPAGVTSIGTGAFSNCVNLAAINVNPTNAFYSSVNGVLFDKNQDTLIQFPGGLGGSYVIPGSVSTIAGGAFADCSHLLGVIIPGSVTSIGHDAFAGCTGLVSAYFQGNAPPNLGDAYFGDGGVTVYYLSGTGGWGSTFGGAPADLFPFNFTVNNNQVTITAYIGSDGTVAFPGSIAGLPVVSLANNAFQGDSFINVTIPDSVTNIGSQAFLSCPSVTNFNVGSGVVSIGEQAFANCASLLTITVDPANPFYSSTNGVLFDKNQDTLVEFPAGVGSYTIPDSVTNIADGCFFYCYGLTNITIPDSVTIIGNDAFNSCVGLTDVTIPDSVNRLGNGAFANCNFITNIVIGTGVTSLGNQAFFNCFGLTDIFIGSAVTNVGYEALQGCITLMTITVDPANSFYSSVDGVLFDKSQDTLVQFPGGRGGSYTIPGSVTTIGVEAFDNCGNVTNVVIPDSVISIEAGAFNLCYRLGNITIPNSVTSIGNQAFYNCYALASATIGYGVTSLGNYAFGNCYNLSYALFLGDAPPDTGNEFDADPIVVYYLNGTTGWGPTFGEAPTALYLYDITFNDGAITITGNNGASGDLVIPASIDGIPVVSIGPSAFAGAGLTSVLIPDTVTNIGDQAFGSIPSLTSATFGGDAPPDLGTAFSGDSSTTVYYFFGTTGWGLTFGGAPTQLIVQPGLNYTAANDAITITGYTGSSNLVVIPDTIGGLPVTAIGASAFDNDTNLIGVSITANVTNVGDQAFASCPSLVSAFFGGNAPTDLGTAFSGDSSATVSYLSGTTGWGPAFGGITANPVPYIYEIDSGIITLDEYIGSGGTVVIPSYIGAWPVNGIQDFAFDGSDVTSIFIPAGVTSIGRAFFASPSLTAINVDPANPFYRSVNGVFFDKNQQTLIQFPCAMGGSYTIPNSVTSIAVDAFFDCTNLTDVTIGNGVTSIGTAAFEDCFNLANITIPDSVTSIGTGAFVDCINLANVIIPGSVTSVGRQAFIECASLSAVLFTGNAPPDTGFAFSGDHNIVYYLPGTTGWHSTFGRAPTALWNPQASSVSATGGQFGFNIIGPANAVVIVEACTNLVNPVWVPVSTNTLTGGVSIFSDPQTGTHPYRFYGFGFPQ